MEMMDYIYKNEGLTKVSASLRHPEARNKIEKATLRNGEISKIKIVLGFQGRAQMKVVSDKICNVYIKGANVMHPVQKHSSEK